MIRCAKCGATKATSAFAKSKRSASGYQSYCKACQKTYRTANAERISAQIRAVKAANPDKYLDLDLRRKYGISLEDYRRMERAQDGKCAICKKPPRPRGDQSLALAIDHDHQCCPSPARSCGRCVRSLLCWHCNFALGLFGDNPEVIREAAFYLEGFADVQR